MNLSNFVDTFGVTMAKLFKYVISSKNQKGSLIFDEKKNVIDNLFDEDNLHVDSYDLGNYLLESLSLNYDIIIKNNTKKLAFNKDVDIFPNSLYFFNFSTQDDSFFIILITTKDRAHMKVIGDNGVDIYNNDYLIENFRYLWKSFLGTSNLNLDKESDWQEPLTSFVQNLFSTTFQTYGGEFPTLDKIQTFLRFDNIEKNEKMIIRQLIDKFKSYAHIFAKRNDSIDYKTILKDMENAYNGVPNFKRGWFF